MAQSVGDAAGVTDRSEVLAKRGVAAQLRSLALAIAQSPVAVMVTDLQGRIEYVNQHFTDMSGYPAAEVLGRTPALLQSGLTPPSVYQQLWTAIGAGEVWRGELCNRRKDGELYYHSASISPLRDVTGQVTGFVAVQEDISELRQTLNALRESEGRFRSVLDAAGLAVWDWDLATGSITWLGHHAEILGKPADIYGNTYDSLMTYVHQEDRPQLERKVTEALTAGTEFSNSHRVIWPDGTVRWILARGQFRYTEAGAPTRMYGAIMDITERRALEVQLLQAQKIEAVGQLAAGIAHEINTPTQYVGDNLRFLTDAFTSLLGVVGLYRDLAVRAREQGVDTSAADAAWAAVDGDFLTTEIPRATAQSLEGTERVSSIVRAMKEFSHPGGETAVPVDLNRAVRNTCSVSRNEWKYVADVVLDLDPDLPPVPCLLGEIQQVLLNLIVNAAHAIHDRLGDSGDKGTITISTCAKNEIIEVRITDTGAGIPDAIRPRIFEPFFTTKEVGRGTGQGLAIAREVVVQKHRGSLSFDSTLGVGTTFLLRLPLHTEDALGVEG